MEASRSVSVLNVQCVACSRVAGQIVSGVYLHDAHVQAPRSGASGPRCGECGGSLYVEVDSQVPAELAERMLHQHTRLPAVKVAA